MNDLLSTQVPLCSSKRTIACIKSRRGAEDASRRDSASSVPRRLMTRAQVGIRQLPTCCPISLPLYYMIHSTMISLL